MHTFRYPTVLTIAGSDSGGCAGIQADLKTISSLGCFGCSVITAITAQNTRGVAGVYPVENGGVEAQMEAVLSDFRIDAIKTGMLFSTSVVKAVVEGLQRYGVRNLVADPVMISTSGHRLIQEETIQAIIDELFPLVLLLTPNLDEAQLLAEMPIRSFEEMEQAARRIQQKGVRNVLIKGGHLPGEVMRDLLLAEDGTVVPFDSPKVDTLNSHGTGCTLSSAIASHLALGQDLIGAIGRSKEYITEALRQGADVRVGDGHGSLNHLFAPQALKKMVL